MRKLLFLILVFAANYAIARSLTIDEADIDFGEQIDHSTYSHDVHIWNKSNSLVTIKSIKKLVGQGEAKVDKTTIGAGESTLLHLKINLDNGVGATSTRFLLETESADGNESYGIRIAGYVDSILEESTPSIDFGVIDKAKPLPSMVYTLKGSSEDDLEITEIFSTPDFLETTIRKDKRSVLIFPRTSTTLGIRSGTIKLRLNSKVQSELWVNVVLDMHGSVIPNQNPLDFGLERSSGRAPARLQISSRDGSNFRIGNPAIKDAYISSETVDCLPEKKRGCRAFLFRLTKDQPIGQVFGTASFDLPDSKENLVVNFGGLLLDDKTVVQPLENLKSASQKESSTGSSSQSLEDAIKHSMSPASDESVLPGDGPLLKWQIGNESAIYGYAIFRSATLAVDLVA